MNYAISIGVCAGSLLMVACGGGVGEVPLAAGEGGLRIAGLASKAMASHPAGEIAYYRITITASDMDPVVSDISAERREGVIEGLPPGGERQVSVEAFNQYDEVVHVGTTADVVIRGGASTEITVPLETVPIVANIREDASLLNTRLKPMILAAPGSELSLAQIDLRTGTAEPFIAANLNTSTIPTDPTSGLVEIATHPLAPGAYQLIVEDLRSGLRSTRTMRIVEGRDRRAAPFYSAGTTNQPSITTARLGVPWSALTLRGGLQ